MGELLILGIVAFVLYSIYRAGKRIGSRKAYGIGRFHGRRRR